MSDYHGPFEKLMISPEEKARLIEAGTWPAPGKRDPNALPPEMKKRAEYFVDSLLDLLPVKEHRRGRQFILNFLGSFARLAAENADFWKIGQ